MEDPMRDPDPTYGFEPKKSNTPTTWRKLGYALRGKDERQRAAVAAMLVNGTVPPSPPTVAAAARICRTSPYLVRRALNGGQNGNGKTPSLTEHLLHSTLAERVDAARAFGLARLWDEMVMPAMNEEDLDRQSKTAK
jgi:hypothetical protein